MLSALVNLLPVLPPGIVRQVCRFHFSKFGDHQESLGTPPVQSLWKRSETVLVNQGQEQPEDIVILALSWAALAAICDSAMAI